MSCKPLWPHSLAPWQRFSQCFSPKGSLPQSTPAFLDLFLAASSPPTLCFLLSPILSPFSAHSLFWGRVLGGNMPVFPSDRQDTLLSPLSSAPGHVVFSAAFLFPCDVCCRSLVGGLVGNGSAQPTLAGPAHASPAPHHESPSPLGTPGSPCLLFWLFR